MNGTPEVLRAEAIHSQVNWPDVLEANGIPAERLALRNGKSAKNGPCPACGGADRFFFDNRKGRGDFHCRNCGAGDGFDLIMRVHKCTFVEAKERVIRAAGLVSEQPIAKRATQMPEAATTHDWSPAAAAILAQCQELRGTLGETYLRHRGCALPPPDSDLRFLPSSGSHPPSLCGIITDATTAKPISLHFTRLAADGLGKAGSERDRSYLTGHRKAGGVIRLWPDECVTYGLAIGEGIESCLAAAHAYRPVWSAMDAGNLSSFPALPGIESLSIIADNDDAGMAAAAKLAQRWKDAGKQVRLLQSIHAGEDLNDLVNA